MGIITPELSKAVGWERGMINNYPTLEAVNTASDYQLLVWYRFLLSPSTEEEIQIMNRLCERMKESR